jgi:tetratricopeptide (TPR) repeat protein
VQESLGSRGMSVKSRGSSSVRAVLRTAVGGLLACAVLLGTPFSVAADAYLGEAGAEPLAVAPPAGNPAALLAAARGSTSEAGSELDRAWFDAGNDLDRRAQNLERRALELGAGDAEAAARALISPKAPGTPMRNTRLATRLAPHLPIAHVAEAAALWEEGRRSEAGKAIVRAASVLPKNLEASLWLVASLLAMFAVVALVGSLCFVAVAGATFFARAAHDLGDAVSSDMPSFARAAMLATLLLIPILLGQGLLGFVLGLFAIGFVYGSGSHRLSLALAAALIVLALYPGTRITGIALGALGADPVADASFAVVQGTETRPDIETLELAVADDALAEQALAMRARRRGDMEEAQRRYTSLLERRPDDPVVSTNLANLEFRKGNSDAAITLYEGAATRMNSAIVLFNLSQAYAGAFRMEDFENTMRLAQGLSPDTADALSRTGDASFVADLPMPIAEIRERMVAAAEGEELQQVVVAALAPGALGSSWWMTTSGFVLVALFATLFGRRYEHSSRCGRCGRSICGRCDGTYWNNEICDPCHHLYHLPETTDPTLRTQRLAVLRRRESRLDRIALGLSMAVPGAAGFLAKRPDHAFLGMLLFLLAAVMLVSRNGVVPDPLVVGGLASVGFTLAAMLALTAYAGVVLVCVLIRRSQ